MYTNGPWGSLSHHDRIVSAVVETQVVVVAIEVEIEVVEW